MADDKKKGFKTRAWIGMYRDGSLGWQCPEYLRPGDSEMSRTQREILKGTARDYAKSDFYRVEITVKPLRDKRGREIVRRVRNADGGR